MRSYHNFDLSDFNSYKIQARCSEAYFPETEKDLVAFFKKNDRASIEIIGNGNNIILTKDFYKKPFLIFNGTFNEFEIENNIIMAESGATLEELSIAALENNLSGLEIFYDIPSSVGGAVVMNAGTKEGEIKDLLLKVRYLDLVDMQIKEIAKEDISFEYRNSFFQKHSDKIVLKAWFQLEQGNSDQIKAKMEENKQIRWAKQPREFPNSGSVFKRPRGYYVGQIIEELNLKGFKIGGAMVSEKHGGFIINTGNATGIDILNLITFIKEKVNKYYGIDLEIEQRII